MDRTRAFILICFLQALLVVSAGGQVLPFTHYTPDNDRNPLPSAEVHQVYQDQLGYVWLVIFSSGLVRYDGAAMETFTTADGLRDLAVWEVLEDHVGRLWVASNAGLVVSEKPLREYEDATRIRFVDNLDGIPLTTSAISNNRIALDRDGRVWAGTGSSGIIRYSTSNSAATSVDTISTVIDGSGIMNPVRALAARTDGSMWVGIRGGELLVFDSGGRRRFVIGQDRGAPSESVNTLYEGPDGTLWGGTRTGGLFFVDESVRPPLVQSVTTPLQSNIAGIYRTPDHRLWIASEGSGLLQLDSRNPEATQRLLARANGLLSENVHDIMRDREGNMWIAQAGGVSKLRYNFRAIENFTSESYVGEQPVLPSPSINALYVDESTDASCWIWAGTSEGGLACIHRDGTSIHLSEDDGLQNNWVNTVVRDERGRVWAGTVRGISGIASVGALPASAERHRLRLDGSPAELANYRKTSILSAEVTRIDVGDGTMTEAVWMAGYRTIYLLVGNDWYLLTEESGLPPAIFHAATMDDDGFVWVGSRDQGLFRSTEPLTIDRLRSAARAEAPVQLGSSSATFGRVVTDSLFARVWSTDDGAPGNQVESLLVEGGRLWVGMPEGLVALDRTNLQQLAFLTAEDGLGAGNAVSVARSPVTGHLWVGTNSGLSEVDPNQQSVLRTITKGDGLIDNEVWYYGSVKVDSEGTVYFGTAKGLAIYRPYEDEPNKTEPTLHLRKVSYAEFGRGQNELLVEYAAASFGNERDVRFKTRLVGYDADWSEEKDDIKIRYTNLKAFVRPRNYRFEVLARNESDVWTSVPLTYNFSVNPAPWLQWWAFLGYFSLVGGAIYVVDQFQRRRLLRIERGRAAIREAELRTEAAEAKASLLKSENKRKSQELEDARKLQLSMLPEEVPIIEGVSITAYMKTATEVGGDFYDFIYDEAGVLTFAIGDATGHSAQSGLMVTTAKCLFSMLTGEEDIVEFLRNSTRVIKRMGLQGMYMSFAIGRLDEDKLQMAGAGIPPGLLYHAGTGEIEMLPLKGMPLGSFADFPYQALTVKLRAGDTLLLMTDGLPELFDEEGSMLGYDRSVEIFMETAAADPDAIVRHLMAAAKEWGGTRPPHDDITFVVIKKKPVDLHHDPIASASGNGSTELPTRNR